MTDCLAPGEHPTAAHLAAAEGCDAAAADYRNWRDRIDHDLIRLTDLDKQENR